MMMKNDRFSNLFKSFQPIRITPLEEMLDTHEDLNDWRTKEFNLKMIMITFLISSVTIMMILRISIKDYFRSIWIRWFKDSNRFLIYSHYHSPILDQTNQLTLRSILNKYCPSLVGPTAYFSPTPWLFSGHLQTIYSAFADFSKIDPVNYERRVIKVPDGGQIALDFSPPNRFSNKNDPSPTLIVLHGLTGGSHESYVRSLIYPLINNFHWRVVVANFRGCAGSQLTSPKLYNAGATEDIRLIVRFLRTILCPLTPLHAVGFSLGANVLAKYLGEEGDQTFIKSAVVVGNPWDLYSGHCFLESSFLGKIYSRALASNLRALMKRHLKVFKSRPNPIDLHALFSNPNQSLYEFDSIVTRALGKFTSTEAYYKSQSSIHTLDRVKVPLLSINALDDPIVSIDAAPIESALDNPYLVFLISKHGGHLGWFEGFWNPKRMINRPIVEWFMSMNQGIPNDPKMNYLTMDPAYQSASLNSNKNLNHYHVHDQPNHHKLHPDRLVNNNHDYQVSNLVQVVSIDQLPNSNSKEIHKSDTIQGL